MGRVGYRQSLGPLLFHAANLKTDWFQARLKCNVEGECRSCQRDDVGLEAAHTFNRATQDQYKENGQRYVPPEAIIPLCKECHMKYDAHQLDIFDVITREEWDNIVGHVGEYRATRRLRSTRDL